MPKTYDVLLFDLKKFFGILDMRLTAQLGVYTHEGLWEITFKPNCLRLSIKEYMYSKINWKVKP
jgi:hypothetical protein